MKRRLVLLLAAGSVLAALSAAPRGALAAALPISADQTGVTARLGVMSWREIPFRTVVHQKYDFSCGSAALATLLRYHYDQNVDEAGLFKAMWDTGDQAKIRKLGFSLLDMKRVLEAHGFKADGYRLSLEQIDQFKLPAIALITVKQYRHFVVIKGVRGDRVLIGDPAQGLKVYAARDFLKVWNGVAFLIHGGPGAAPSYNLASEWAFRGPAPLSEGVDRDSVASFMNELPPVVQISPQFILPSL